MKFSILPVFLAFSMLFFSCACSKNAPEPVRLIVDTDLGPDYDDVGALAVAHALADNSEADILAIISSNVGEHSIPCIEAINYWYGRREIPVGIARTSDALNLPCEREIKWTDSIPAHFDHGTETNATAEDAVALYRRILAENPHASINICNIGAFTNLAALLKSQPDQYSDLNGLDLVRQKAPRLTVMAACFPEGREYNVYCNPSAAQYVVDNWPCDIIFCGFEIGLEIYTGPRLVAMKGDSNPIKETYQLNMNQGEPEGRWSWDQATVLAAVKGISPYYTATRGTVEIDSIGYNRWTPDSEGCHISLSTAIPADSLTVIIEDLMMQKPAK